MANTYEAPRKKIATYGKAARRRMPSANPEYKTVFFGGGSMSLSPEPQISTEFPVIKHISAPAPVRKVGKDTTSLQNIALPIQPVKADIYDVPSEDEVPVSKPKRYVPKPVPRAKLTSSAKSSVFDVPSSEEEERPKAVPKANKHNLKSPTTTARALSLEKPKDSTKVATVVNVPDQRKHLKLSPKAEIAKKAAPVPAKEPLPISKPVMKSGNMDVLPPKGAISAIEARPKTQVQRRPERLQKSHKASPQPQRTEIRTAPMQNTPSPQLSDVEMKDVDPHGKYISPRGIKLWKDMLEPDQVVKIAQTKITGRRQSPGKVLLKSAGVSKPVQKTTRNLPRRRLIDLLVEQSNNSSSSEDESDESEPMVGVESASEEFGGTLSGSLSRAQSHAPESVPALQSASQGSQITGPKFVYGSQRTILAEKDFMQALEADMPAAASQGPAGRRTRRGSIPALPVLVSFHEMDLDEEEGTAKAVRSVHELRQAGANNRFMDELEDFIERIGNPGGAQSSMRRSGLLDLANKLKDKNFSRQFRSNGAEEKLFVHLGQETDIIAGFIMVSILMTIFADGNAPHIIPQLRRQGVTRLLIRLLENQSSITSLCKERKTNMSKVGQSLLVEYQDHVLKLPVWEELKPQVISPRTIALKCLEKMVRQTREAGNPGDIFSKELTSKLFEILKTASNPNTWDLPNGEQAIDFFLALSALESHSITARTAHNEDIWISDFLPVIADTLEVALSQKADEFGETQLLILRLALNVTNNNAKGADVFARPSLLAVMGSVVVTKFKKIARFLREEEFCVVIDHLVLTLGVMINFAEWSTPAREALQSLEGRSNDPLDRMAQLFLDNQERMAEANSVEESQKNVAFGYLSVLLGYFALLPSIAERIRKRSSRKSLRQLVSSIEEFISHHKAVDDLVAADPDGHNPHSGLTQRLESLATKLGLPI